MRQFCLFLLLCGLSSCGDTTGHQSRTYVISRSDQEGLLPEETNPGDIIE